MKRRTALLQACLLGTLVALGADARAQGVLLLRSYPSDLLLASGGRQVPLRTPAPLSWFASLELNDPRHLVILDRSATNSSMEPDRLMVVDLQTRRGEALAAPRKLVRRNQIISFLRYLPATRTFAFRALDNYATALFLLRDGKRRPLPALRRIRGYTFEHQMFADGRLLFVHDPSNHRDRRKPGARQTLYLAAGPTQPARPLLARETFRRAWLTNGGQHVVFLEAAGIDTAAGRRLFRLQALALASKAVTLLTRLDAPLRNKEGRPTQDDPRVYVFSRTPYVAVEGAGGALRVLDLGGHKERVLRLPAGFSLAPLVTSRGAHATTSTTTFHPYLVGKRWVARGVDELVVLRVPDGHEMLRHTYRGRGVQAAVYLPQVALPAIL